MKTISSLVLGMAGLVYALFAINLVYQDSPESLRWFIVFGVTAVGSTIGWLIGLATSIGREFRDKLGRRERSKCGEGH